MKGAAKAGWGGGGQNEGAEGKLGSKGVEPVPLGSSFGDGRLPHPKSLPGPDTMVQVHANLQQ